ncbi:unnamed protein product [Cuscuta epithymum]|uniref:Ribosomal protein L19 n=1 Tax=Cuscuta epithymum TaxID=186058 RepID=A0AAV0C179_9ASTE|nr:unnamed protein product [Cuscuta epithymum]CAH9147187.1 unnamed protein product [Cuscuta epithymum]
MWSRFWAQLGRINPPYSSAFQQNYIAAATSANTHLSTATSRYPLALFSIPSTIASGNVDSGKRIASGRNRGTKEEHLIHTTKNGIAVLPSYHRDHRSCFSQLSTMGLIFPSRLIATMATSGGTVSPDASSPDCQPTPRIKFKRLDKTAKHIMQILDKEAVVEVKTLREIPDIRPGYILQLKVEVPENKRRLSIVKGTVIARRNAGLNTTFRLRRLVAGVGVESLYHLYSPNIKEIKVLDKHKVRRAKLYYLRDRMNALKKR